MVYTVTDFYRQHYFEASDRVICAIKDRFNQLGYAVYRNLEDVLVIAANKKDFDKEVEVVKSFFANDLQLQLLIA